MIEQGAKFNLVSPDQSNVTAHTVLHRAMERWPVTAVETLLEQSRQIDPETVFTGTCYTNHDSTVHHAFINALDHYGRTAVQFLVIRDCSKFEEKEVLMKMLIEYGADLKAISNDGTTILPVTASIGFIDMVHLLMERGSNIEVITSAGVNTLHFAVEGSSASPAFIRYLTEDGMSLLARDQHGWTSLHYAAATCNVSAIQALLEIVLGVDDYGDRIDHGDTRGPYTSSPKLKNIDELIHIVDDQGQSMLHIVGSHWHKSQPYAYHCEQFFDDFRNTVQLLLDLGADHFPPPLSFSHPIPPPSLF